MFDWAADGAAKLIAMERRAVQSRSPVICVKDRVAQVFESGAMELIGPGLGQHVDNAAGKTPVFSIVGVSLDLEFLYGIGVRQDVSGVTQAGHVVTAVQIIVY